MFRRIKPAWPVLQRGHRHARHLIGAWPIAERSPTALRDLVSGHDLTVGDAAPSMGAPGRGIHTTVGSSTATSGDSTAFLPTANNASVVIYFEKLDGTNRASAGFGLDGGGTGNRFGTHMPWSDGNVYFDYGGASDGTTRLTISGETFEEAVWVFCVGPRGMECWKNGTLVASNSGTPTRTGSTAGWGLGTHGGWFADDDRFYDLRLYGQQLHPGICQELNPETIWDLYVPRRVLVTVSGGATGTSAATLLIPTSAASGDVKHTGTSAATLLLPTSSASGTATTAVTGTSAATLLVPTSSASGTAKHVGTSAPSLPVPTSSASGTVSAAAVFGTSAATLLLPTSAAAGTAKHTGTSAPSLPLPTSSASGTAKHVGTSAATLPLPTSSAAGLAITAITGTSAPVLPVPTSTATGTRKETGTSAITLLLPTSTATGSAISGVTGTASTTSPMSTSSVAAYSLAQGTFADGMMEALTAVVAAQGMTVTFVRPNGKTYRPMSGSTSQTGTTRTSLRVGGPFGSVARLIDRSTVRERDRTLIVGFQDLGYRPQSGRDTVEVGTEVYAIESVRPIRSQNFDIAYEVRIR